jgi:hypothetical protein
LTRTLLLTGVVLAGLAAVPVANGAESASRIVDRTFVCPMVGVGHPDSVRALTVVARSFDVFYEYPPSLGAFNGQGQEPSVAVSARTGPRPGPVQETGGVWVPRTDCQATRDRIRFSSKGLAPAARDRELYRCDVPAKVVIRIRAVFTRPTVFTRDLRAPSSSVAKGQISTAWLAAATARGRKPLAFATVDDSTGKAKMFVSSSCAPA